MALPSAEEFENDQSIEAMWAMQAYEHAEIYFNLLSSVDVKLLRLTPFDDTIYKLFRKQFPDLNVNVVDENSIKSAEGKIVWRQFCEQFKVALPDYNNGTLLRSNASGQYNETNTMLVARIQFYAIELARNREGVNDIIRKKFGKHTASDT